MAEKSRLKLMIYAILVVIILLGLIGIITILGGKAFYLELIGFLFLLLLSLIGLIGYTTSWGERVLFFVFLFYLLNLVLVWYFTGLLYLILLFLAVVGMLLSFPKKSFPLREGRVAEVESTYKIETSEPHSEVFDLPLEEVKIEEPVIKSVKSKTKAKHSA